MLLYWLGRGNRRLRNQKVNRGYPDYCIVKISQNTEESPGDLRRLAVTQTPIRSYQLILV